MICNGKFATQKKKYSLTWSPIPVIIGEFQKAANLATGSRANAQAGPINAITESRKCISAASPGAIAPEQDGYLYG